MITGTIGKQKRNPPLPFSACSAFWPGSINGIGNHVNHCHFRCFNWNEQLPNMDLKGNGLKMCYGRRTGYGGYGDWTRGGRQIVLRENVSEIPIETWIRLEDETARAHVVLNSTYGQDRYAQASQGRKRFSPSKGLIYVSLFLYLSVILTQI